MLRTGRVDFTRKNNGLNQDSNWSPSVIYYDDNYPGWGPAGNGVMMADGWITESYNALNQPVAVWSPAYSGGSNFMWFGYDPLVRCVKRWVSPASNIGWNATYMYYDGWSIIQEGDNIWSPTRLYVQGNRIDELAVTFNVVTSQYGFHQYDARGHCILTTDISGNMMEEYDYDAFGKPHFYSASSGWSWDLGYSEFGNRFLFTGREWLKDLRLYDFRNRLYHPELGRFLQPDPKQFAAGDYNLYRYCHNDPVNKNDPLGLDLNTAIQQALFESGTTLLGGVIGGVIGGGGGALGFAGGPTGFATTPAGAIAGAAVGSGVGLGIGRLLSPVLFKEGGGSSNVAPKSEPQGAHTTFETDANGKVTHYETKVPQTNPQNPNPWQSVKRFDGEGKGHFNKATQQKVETPHVHEPQAPGGVRVPKSNELPKGY
jgi:RHS repeat-associated protein